MAQVKPFAALRPDPTRAASICELPYDVMSSAEARELAAGNPNSFLHISKPEIDLPRDTDPYAAEVYAKGAENFRAWQSQKLLCQDAQARFHLYRQTMGAHTQLGLVAVVSCLEYEMGEIKKHELTRPDKEDDRVRHLEALNAQTGPVFLTYRAVPELDALFGRIKQGTAAVDFTSADGVQHTSWTVSEPKDAAIIEAAFSSVPCLYIADGHHRSAAAHRVAQARRGAGQSGFFLAVIFPHDQMQILPYNRAVKDLRGLSEQDFLSRLDSIFLRAPKGEPRPKQRHDVSMFLGGRWHSLQFRPHITATQDPLEKLDVSLLQNHVLGPLLGIDNPRTSQRIAFVGGIRGTDTLEKRVQTGEFACAFSMHPTGIEELMEIADAGGLMPPKSTWFEPKLRDGMFCHLI